jgi:hypothetical protein
MPRVCEISKEAYCRPNDVIRRLIIHAPDRLSPILTIFAQLRPIDSPFQSDSFPLASD